MLVIEPYRCDGAWVFDDERVGLQCEPFVAGITEMIDRLVAEVPNADGGFRLRFAAVPFEGYRTSLAWVRADPVEGNWYRAEDAGDEGWLCPALVLVLSLAAAAHFRQGGAETAEHLTAA